MSNKLQTTQSQAVVDPSKLFAFFQEFTADRKVFRDKLVKDKETGNLVIRPVELVIPAKNRLRNEGVGIEAFGVLAGLMKDADRERFAVIIKEDRFEVVKAVAACNARNLALDDEVLPTGWEEAEGYQSSTLAGLVKYKGKVAAAAVVQAIVSRFTLNFGTKNQIDGTAAKRLASEILKTYYSLTIADLKYIFGAASRMAPEGLTKKRFGFSVDAQQILELIQDSFEDKSQDVERREIDNHIGGFNVAPPERRYRPERRGEPGPETALSGDEIAQRNEDFAEAKKTAQEQADKALGEENGPE